MISVDFKKTFDKTQHHHVLAALSSLGISVTALEWFACFLSGCTEQVRVENDLSDPGRVTSGIVLGLTLGPPLFMAFTDSLLRQLAFPAGAFADDFKFVADVTVQP